MLNASPNNEQKVSIEMQTSTSGMSWRQELENPPTLWERHHLP